MNLKKFIGSVSALAIAASAFASITITASAADFGSITESITNQAISVGALTTDYRITFDADVYVPDGGKAEIYYNGGYKSGNVNGVGPKFIFDATANDGIVIVKKDDGSNNRIVDGDYGEYYAGHTVHVNIKTAITSNNRIGNSIITLSAVNGDNEAFHSNGRGGYRYPTNSISGGRGISGRNLATTRTFSAIDFTVSGDATIANAKIVTEKIAITQETELVASYNNDNGAATYSAVITNDTINGLKSVSATATDTEGTSKTSDAAEITEIAPGSTIVLGVVVENKTADELNSVTVTLK